MHVLWFDLLFCKTERAHLHHRNPECAGQNVSYHNSCAHNFKTERVHLHHCIPLRWGTQWIFFLIPQIRLSHRVNKAGAPAPPHTPDVRDTMVNLLLDHKNWQFCPAHRGYAVVQVHGSCLKPVCQSDLWFWKKNEYQKMDDSVPHLRGMQWCRCTRSVLKPCAHDLWYTKKNWRLCPAHGGYAVVQVHLLCFKAVWQPFLYRTSEPSADGRRSTCTTGSPSGHSDRGPLEVHKVWKSLTCSCNSSFG